MEIREIGRDAVRLLGRSELASALKQDDSLVWVDVPCGDDDGLAAVADDFGFDERAIEDCRRRNPAPKLHVYEGHVFLVLHMPHLGRAGHVHSIELDLFIGPDFVVTVHGPVSPDVDPEVALAETRFVAHRLDQSRRSPGSVDDIVHAVVTGLNRQMNVQLAELRYDTWQLEKTVTAGVLGDPEAFLEEMFAVRLGLQAIRTMAALNHEVYARMALLRNLRPAAHELIQDSVDQFQRVMASADIQTQYLQGVIEFYQTRINTKMTVAAERLAVIAAVTLPVTAVSSVFGMNVIVNDQTRWVELVVLLVLMGAMSSVLLVWARRQGWW